MAARYCPKCKTDHEIVSARIGAPLLSLNVRPTPQPAAPPAPWFTQPSAPSANTGPEAAAPSLRANILKDVKAPSGVKGRDVADLPEPERSEVVFLITTNNTVAADARLRRGDYFFDRKVRARLQGATVGIGPSTLFRYLSNQGRSGPEALQWSKFEPYDGFNVAWSLGDDGLKKIENILAFGNVFDIERVSNWISHQLTRFPHEAPWCGSGEFRCSVIPADSVGWIRFPEGVSMVQKVTTTKTGGTVGYYPPLKDSAAVFDNPIWQAKRAIMEFAKRCDTISSALRSV